MERVEIEKMIKNTKLSERVRNRTFGCELEAADVLKDDVLLFEGSGWTRKKFTTFFNSTGERVSINSDIGGELNTRVMKLNSDDLLELQRVINSIRKAGGKILWDFNWHIHIGIKDLTLEECKKLYTLIYVSGAYLQNKFKLPMWYRSIYLAPNITEDEYRLAIKSDSLENFDKTFNNGSERGYIRHYIAMAQRSRIGTAEFRLFAGTFQFAEFLYAILFCYRFIDYALSHSVDEIKAMKQADLEKAFLIDEKFVTENPNPLLWAAAHDDNTTILGESFKKSRKLLSFVKEQAEKFKVVHVVNSFFFDLEYCIESKIKLYTKEYFVYVLFQAIKGEITELQFSDELKWLSIKSDNPLTIFTRLMIFNSVKKHNGAKDVYHKSLYDDFEYKINHYQEKYEKKYKKLVESIKAKNIELFYGSDLSQAIENCKEDEVVIYQSEFNSSIKASSNALLKYLPDFGHKEKLPTYYDDIDESSTNHIIISPNKYLGRRMVFEDNRTYVYSNTGEIGDCFFKKRPLQPLKYKRLPDDYIITKESRLTFMKASMSEIDYLRMIYLKKGIILGSAPFCYLWFIDKYVFGATMFDFMKVNKHGMNAVSMKSDFVIDHPIARLSKLLIMGTLSSELKEELDIRFKSNVDKISTSVFTNKPVSMKYRGIYQLDERDNGKLYYSQVPAKLGTLKLTL